MISRLLIFYIIILFPFFKPDYIVGVGSKLGIVYNVLLLISFFIAMYMYLKCKRNNEKMPLITLIVLYNFIVVVASLVNKNCSLYSALMNSMTMIALSIIVDYGTRNHNRIILKSLLCILNFLITVNLITIFIFPNGMWISQMGYWENWFLGYDNNHILIMLPAIIISYIYNKTYFSKKTINFYYTLLIVNITVLKTWSATSLVGILLLDCIMLFEIDKVKILQPKKLLLLSVIFFIFIIILRIQNVFSFFIVDLLHKDLTFSNRTHIWDFVIGRVLDKPILGYGLQASTYRYIISSPYSSFHAHNFFLEICYRGGILLLISVILILRKTLKKLSNSSNKKMSNFMMYCVVVYAIILLTEYYEPIYYFYLFVIFYNIDFLRGDGEYV